MRFETLKCVFDAFRRTKMCFWGMRLDFLQCRESTTNIIIAVYNCVMFIVLPDAELNTIVFFSQWNSIKEPPHNLNLHFGTLYGLRVFKKLTFCKSAACTCGSRQRRHFWAHLCTVGSYASLSVRLSVGLSVWFHWTKIQNQEVIHITSSIECLAWSYIGMSASIVHHKSDRKTCVLPTADRNSQLVSTSLQGIGRWAHFNVKLHFWPLLTECHHAFLRCWIYAPLITIIKEKPGSQLYP